MGPPSGIKYPIVSQTKKVSPICYPRENVLDPPLSPFGTSPQSPAAPQAPAGPTTWMPRPSLPTSPQSPAAPQPTHHVAGPTCPKDPPYLWHLSRTVRPLDGQARLGLAKPFLFEIHSRQEMFKTIPPLARFRRTFDIVAGP